MLSEWTLIQSENIIQVQQRPTVASYQQESLEYLKKTHFSEISFTELYSFHKVLQPPPG